MRNLSALFCLLPLTAVACSAAPADSTANEAMLNEAAAVPQAPLFMCVDAANPDNKAVITVTNDLAISWNMFGGSGTSAMVGAGFAFGAPEEPTMLVLVLESGRRMVVRGNYEEERLVSIEAAEGRLDCGPTSRMKAYNVRNLLDATNASYEKRAELARCDFDGTPSTLMVRPALRGAGAIIEGTAPSVGRFQLVATSDGVGKGGTSLFGKGATGIGDASGVGGFTTLTFDDGVSSDASPEHRFPANTCDAIGLNYARGLIAGEAL